MVRRGREVAAWLQVGVAAGGEDALQLSRADRVVAGPLAAPRHALLRGLQGALQSDQISQVLAPPAGTQNS